ncbi:hypothetical protein P171DRAFT_435724 [Karstenula rhodostoma CBS 690.94]|uniref:Uncharacterized protein n=1 Tax=Karstenula rhodostoma CBS 690.94 TaxID=1392251 RepID=A0A9P4PB51_9PLEO|nr:hypothetical protein P171DRAFT_435724 [Karstenula rhodostoma CBS 690.94]
MSQNREFGNVPEHGKKSPRTFFAQALSDGLQDRSKRKHLVILFFVLHFYALHALCTGYVGIAIATALPAFLLPYTWTFNQRYETILGIPFRYVLPYQGPRYKEEKYSFEHRKSFEGPALDTYAGCFYILPLYLALWYSFIGIVSPERVTFFVLVAVLISSRPEYWGSQNSFSPPDGRLRKLMLGLTWQFLVGAFTFSLWTVTTNYMCNEVSQRRASPSQLYAVEEGPAVALACVLGFKVIDAWEGTDISWQDLLFAPYEMYWEDSTTDEEILIWEMLERERIEHAQRVRDYSLATAEEKAEYEAHEWKEAQERQRRRLGPRANRLGPDRPLYREESPEPEALYRSSESYEEDDRALTGAGSHAPAPAQNPTPASRRPGVAVGGSIRGHPIPAPPPRRPRPAATRAPMLTAPLDERARITFRLEETLRRDPALAAKLIESKVTHLPAAEATLRRRHIKKGLVLDTQARIARQRTAKPRRASTSIAPRVWYNGKPSLTTSYISIIEDPLALDAGASYSDSDGALTDVYTLEPTYPHSTFPRRAWREALAGTFSVLLADWKSWAYSTFLGLGKAFCAAVLVRLVLISTGTWPLEPTGGDKDAVGDEAVPNEVVVESTWYAIRVVIGMVSAWWFSMVEYWGRMAREVVEFLVNDWFFAMSLVVFVGVGKSLWVWFDRGEVGAVFLVVGWMFRGATGLVSWVFTELYV